MPTEGPPGFLRRLVAVGLLRVQGLQRIPLLGVRESALQRDQSGSRRALSCVSSAGTQTSLLKGPGPRIKAGRSSITSTEGRLASCLSGIFVQVAGFCLLVRLPVKNLKSSRCHGHSAEACHTNSSSCSLFIFWDGARATGCTHRGCWPFRSMSVSNEPFFSVRSGRSCRIRVRPGC